MLRAGNQVLTQSGIQTGQRLDTDTACQKARAPQIVNICNGSFDPHKMLTHKRT